jgi:hemolysin activation/secretion protein
LIGSDGMRLTSTTSVARARANVQPRTLNLSSTQLRSELKLSYPVVKSAMEQLTASGGFYFSQLRYDLNHLHLAKDRAFSTFGEISEVKQLSDKWSGSLYGRVTAGFELPYGGGVPRSRVNAARDFGKLNLSTATAYSVTPSFSLLLRADGQAATGSLMAAEEISYGGERFGRGYDSATISGDHGIALSLQPQYSLSFIPGWRSSIFAGGDYARVFNSRGDLQRDATLLSLGGGIGVSHDGYSVSVGVGQPMKKVPFYAQRLRPRFFISLQAKI